ncbi:NTP transferase domain-containing protein [Alkalihalobacterium sp. APHAB7]|uniref:phosphocholine cytidylyltransferase family protein n=1 Tax=Alkalihalobacterium sp. APHAB7 TaxID=3402081 RepID=UPI003AAE5346
MKVIILGAGLGSRLRKPYPKPLTMLTNGSSIMQNQIKQLVRYIDIHDIYVVVGFKKELIMEAFPDLIYIYNSYFDSTNTSKSLLNGLQKLRGHDVLWLNGDVVFDHEVIERVIRHRGSCMAVNTASVAEEEVKYLTNSSGEIIQVSKEVKNGLGEAVGINKVCRDDVELLIDKLHQCKDNDYFEKGLELSIGEGLKLFPVDISDLLCTEVDFKEDLDKVNAELLKR